MPKPYGFVFEVFNTLITRDMIEILPWSILDDSESHKKDWANSLGFMLQEIRANTFYDLLDVKSMGVSNILDFKLGKDKN